MWVIQSVNQSDQNGRIIDDLEDCHNGGTDLEARYGVARKKYGDSCQQFVRLGDF